jgi:hypothetical protein
MSFPTATGGNPRSCSLLKGGRCPQQQHCGQNHLLGLVSACIGQFGIPITFMVSSWGANLERQLQKHAEGATKSWNQCAALDTFMNKMDTVMPLVS